MTWTPNASVTIAGVDFSGKALNGISISYGRPSIWEQARSSYAQIAILNDTNVDNHFEINDSVVISIQDSDGTIITAFTGNITEISNAIDASGSVKTVATQNITAVGPFAAMSRVLVGSTDYPKEYDDVRINRIFTEAGVTVDVVDTPGVYELSNRPSNATDAYSLAAYYAGMCFGYIYETKTGAVGYANESRRTLDIGTSGYLNIDQGYINWRGVNSRKSIADIVNRIVLFYNNNQSKTAEDTHSISNYGLYEARTNTELEDSEQAQNIAERYVSLRSIPATNFSSFNIYLDNPNLLAADLDALINIQMGTAIQIDNLPNAISPVTYKGFVEGWQLIIDRNQALLNIISSDSTYSVVPIRWQDINAATLWSSVDPTAVKTTRTNLVLNPSFEVNTTGWSNASVTQTRITTDSYYGTASNQVVTTATTSNIGFVLTRSTTYAIPITPNQPYTITAWVKNTVGTRTINMQFRTKTTAASGTAVETFTSNSTTSTSWTQLTINCTPTNATGVFAEIFIRYSTAGAIGDTFRADGILCVQASTNTYYWDGTTTDIPTNRKYELAWTGTANNSTSTATAYFSDIPATTWDNVDTVGLP